MEMIVFVLRFADNDGSKWGSLSADINEGSPSAGLSVRVSIMKDFVL